MGNSVMATNRWTLIEDLFVAALGLPLHQRRDFLRQQCGSDADLERQVAHLLIHDAQARDEFLGGDSPIRNLRGLPRTNEANQLCGRLIGTYKVTDIIASGGMGTVYLAEQANPRRNVALKILHSGACSASAEKRFEIESHILAYMRHPNIAQVHEAGSHRFESGATVRYFAMEYVPEARSLTRFADDRSLTLQNRLELFLQLCDAVHHGHQKGVIHRDLKPSNVLVDSDGRVKVIDFGVARLTDSDIAKTTIHTEAGQLLGTLAYMSPEQCSADPSQIDTTTDIYSLGVILFELLTGHMPYDVSNATIHAAARIISEKEPARPSKFNRRLRGDGETIILKAIEKQRSKRYASAAALAEDTQRLLRGEPISARPPTAWVRMVRLAARHPKTAVAISSIAFGLIVLGATFAAVYFVNARPYRIELTRGGNTHDGPWTLQVQSGDRATIHSFSNNALHSWVSIDSDGIRLAKMVDRPSLWGGGRVVILGFAQSADSPFRGQLCLFHAQGDYDRPIWHRTLDQDLLDGMPPDAWPRPLSDPNRNYESANFYVSRAWLLDVFPENENPGPEIIAFHQHHPGSQGALRIYNLNGDVLFQAWQDGGVFDVHWMEIARLLLCAAIKADEDTHVMNLKLPGNHPRVLFALRPRIGDVSEGWIYPYRPEHWNGQWHRPVWYKLPCPLVMADAGKVAMAFDKLSAIISSNGFADRVQLRIEFRGLITSLGTPYNFTVLLDQDGVIQGPQTQDDPSRSARSAVKSFPDPDAFELLDWTEPAPPCRPPNMNSANLRRIRD